MKSVKCGRSVSPCEPSCGLSAEGGCPSMCGMCPSCAFAPKPPASTQCAWKVSEDFRRRFVVELLLRCTNTQVLESIQGALGVTSWTLLTYARSRSPVPAGHPPLRGADRAQSAGRPLGLELSAVWGWFSSSPDWLKSRYLCRLFGLCDPELLRMVANLTSVLLIRKKRGFLQLNGSSRSAREQDQDSDGDSEEPALMVVPGSLRSVSGVSRHRDFIGCLPVDLSKRILGLLSEHTLKSCQKVCRYWKHLAHETMEEIRFRRIFQDQIRSMMKHCRHVHKVSPTYANIVEVPVPVKDDEEGHFHRSGQKVEPVEAACAKTKMVQMEERNVYCGAYYTTVLLDNEDAHRVLDYRGGSLMVTGSKDRVVNLLHVASAVKAVSVLKGHVGGIRAVLLCEDRDLVITASCDASIRCWNLKSDKCEMVLYGHTGTVNCLDVHGDRLVSGAKDCLVKVWSLHTGRHFEDFHFKHPSSVQCVKINTTTVYSSCDRGLVKLWDMENASLLRVIDAHRSSVKCLFFDEWHFLSGDSSGQVMAWRVNCDSRECLMTFNHPKEVKSLTLVYLRVVTGCADGKIRVFNFLTGDCLRDLMAEPDPGRILSLHFYDNSILVNATSGVKRYQFAKVFWDYTQSAEGGQGDGKLPFTSAGADPRQKVHDCHSKKPEKAELLHHTCLPSTPTKCQTRARERCETAKQSVMLSQRATSERMKKRGLHHPLTRDSILLRVNAIQKAQCTDEVSMNMESNARLRDSWGPRGSQDPLHCDLQALKESLQTQTCPLWHPHDAHPRRPKTCVPILKRAVSQNTTNTTPGRAQPRSADPSRPTRRAHGFTACTNKGAQEHMKTSPSLPRISLVGPVREQGGFRQLTATQLDDCVQHKRGCMKSCEQKVSNRVQKQDKTLLKKAHVH